MKKISTVFALAFSLFAIGCEEILQVDDLPYDDRIVIRGVLQAGDTVRTLYVAHTLPYQENSYSLDSYPAAKEPAEWVKDASVVITCDGIQYALHYKADGNYANDSLFVRTGKTYSLRVEWNGKKVEAQTVIPAEPIIDTAYIASSIFVSRSYEHFTEEYYEYTFRGGIRYTNNRVFGVTFALKYGSLSPDTYVFSYGAYETNTTSGAANFEAQSKYYKDRNESFIFAVQSFDESYYAYYNSAENKLNTTTGGYTPVAWNVTGDGIGMFIGASRSVSRQFK